MNHYNCLSGKCQKIKEGQKNRETEKSTFLSSKYFSVNGNVSVAYKV